MFVDLAYAIQHGANGSLTRVEAMDMVLTRFTAEEIANYIERLWECPRVNYRNVLPDGDGDQQRNQSFDIHEIAHDKKVPVPTGNGYWRHIVYAYMLESTNMLSVFQRVLHEWLNGERLPFATQQTQMWLRTTEQLFFTTPQPPSIWSLMSDIRPDRGAIRRNAYYRLLGLDLPAGISDGRSYVKADIANRDFVKAWEQLLYEVWRAYINVKNSSGANSTDVIGIEELMREIREMLTARRTLGTLSREEFDAVTLMGWFHLTILDDTEVVKNLNAQSTSAALRLKKIAELVDVPIQNKTDSFIYLADDMADVLEGIESDTISSEQLYQNGDVTESLTQRMLRVITHWGITTGREVKGITLRGAIGGQTAAPQPAAAAVPLPQTSRFQTVSRT